MRTVVDAYQDSLNIAWENGYKAGHSVAGEWISVKDRMPRMCEPILFVGKNFCGNWFLPQRGYYDGKGWHSDGLGVVPEKITHWRPLPEHPEEEDEE